MEKLSWYLQIYSLILRSACDKYRINHDKKYLIKYQSEMSTRTKANKVTAKVVVQFVNEGR